MIGVGGGEEEDVVAAGVVSLSAMVEYRRKESEIENEDGVSRYRRGERHVGVRGRGHGGLLPHQNNC